MFTLTIFSADITDFAKAIIGFGKIVQFLVKVKMSSNAASNQQHACYDHHSEDTYVGTAGGDIAAAIVLWCMVRETRTGPMKKQHSSSN
jgi:hypothetical protein